MAPPQAGEFSRYFIPRDMDASLARALWAELLGTMLFTYFAGLADSVLGYAMAYAVFVYATQQISGGHLNPAVTFALMCSGLTHWVTGGMYIAAQLVGAIFGALLQWALVPGVTVGHTAPSCFVPAHVTNLELWGWETILTFALVYVVYAVAVAEPGHGSVGPLALGFTIYVAKAAAGHYTGAALNPALVLGPAIVFRCTGTWWVYLLAQLVGAALAAVVCSSIFQFGTSRRSAYGGYGAGEPAREPLVSNA